MSYLLHFHFSPNRARELESNCFSFSIQQLLEVYRPYSQHFLTFCDESPVVILDYDTSLHVPSSSILSRVILNIIFLPTSSSSFRYSSSSILTRALSTALLAAFFFWPYRCLKPVGGSSPVSHAFYHHPPCFRFSPLPLSPLPSTILGFCFSVYLLSRRSTTQLHIHDDANSITPFVSSCVQHFVSLRHLLCPVSSPLRLLNTRYSIYRLFIISTTYTAFPSIVPTFRIHIRTSHKARCRLDALTGPRTFLATEDRTAWREISCAAGAVNVRTDDAD